MRKAVQLTLALMLCATFAQAQETITYDFEDGLMPAGFTLINQDMLIPNEPDDMVFADSAWIVIQSGLLGSYAALSLSWYVDDAGPADDWMILPKLQLGDSPMLSWTAQSTTSSGNFPDSYQVLINTGEPTYDDFSNNGSILLEIAPEEHLTAQVRELDLSAYANQAVYIAFRNITPSGDALLIDDITVTNVITSAVREIDNESFRMALTPNPVSQGPVQLAYTLEESSEVELLIQDMMGRTLQAAPQGRRPAGNNTAAIDINQLAGGTYIVAIRSEKKAGTAKLIVRH